MSRVQGRKKKLELETASIVQGRPVVVRVAPHFAVVRLKGTRTGFLIPWDAVYHAAAKIEMRTRKIRKAA